MSLAQRMIKIFCESLAMNSKVEFPDVSNSSDSGVQISVHNSVQGQPDGIIATATESFWLPQPFQTVFNFLMDKERRPEVKINLLILIFIFNININFSFYINFNINFFI